MIRATTPRHVFIFPDDIDPSACTSILITYHQGNKKIFEITTDQLTIDGQEVSYHLSQEETKLFGQLAAKVQVRILMSGEALASNIISFNVDPVLNDEVLT